MIRIRSICYKCEAENLSYSIQTPWIEWIAINTSEVWPAQRILWHNLCTHGAFAHMCVWHLNQAFLESYISNGVYWLHSSSKLDHLRNVEYSKWRRCMNSKQPELSTHEKKNLHGLFSSPIKWEKMVDLNSWVREIFHQSEHWCTRGFPMFLVVQSCHTFPSRLIWQ